MTPQDRIAGLLPTSTSKWMVCTGAGLDMKAIFNSLDEACVYVREQLVETSQWTATMKESWSDDAVMPLGSLLSLSWSCPLRRMTEDEARATGNKFAEEWIDSKCLPNTIDYDGATSRGVKFATSRVSNVLIDRLSNHLGYIRRASGLNDVSSRLDEIETLIAA